MATNATEVPEQIHPTPINSPPTSPPIAPTTAPIEVPVSSVGVGDIEDETVNQIEADVSTLCGLRMDQTSHECRIWKRTKRIRQLEMIALRKIYLRLPVSTLTI